MRGSPRKTLKATSDAPADWKDALRHAAKHADAQGRFHPRVAFRVRDRQYQRVPRGLGPMFAKAKREGLIRVVDDGLARDTPLYEFTPQGLAWLRDDATAPPRASTPTSCVHP